MSTQFKSFEGLTEIPHPNTLTSSYLPSEIHITRFFGGQSRGVSIQITLDSGKYIQLDNQTAKSFALEILKALE